MRWNVYVGVYRKREGPGTAAGSSQVHSLRARIPDKTRAVCSSSRSAPSPVTSRPLKRPQIKSIMCFSTLTRPMMCVHTLYRRGGRASPGKPTKEDNIFVLRHHRCWWLESSGILIAAQQQQQSVEEEWCCTDAVGHKSILSHTSTSILNKLLWFVLQWMHLYHYSRISIIDMFSLYIFRRYHYQFILIPWEARFKLWTLFIFLNKLFIRQYCKSHWPARVRKAINQKVILK